MGDLELHKYYAYFLDLLPKFPNLRKFKLKAFQNLSSAAPWPSLQEKFSPL
jgi:hypothetical protein